MSSRLKDLYEIVDPDSLKVNLPYHTKLNPKLWDGDNLKIEVEGKLLEIGQAYFNFLNLPEDIKLLNIIFLGSNANYNWTNESDIDIHVVIGGSERYKLIDELLFAKKAVWNNSHNINIYKCPVELYGQLEAESVEAGGQYSVLNNRWLVKPEKQKLDVNNKLVRRKAQLVADDVDRALKTKDLGIIRMVKDRIRHMRKEGLAEDGEYSVNNLAFKVLRNSGYMKKLMTGHLKLVDKSFSLK